MNPTIDNIMALAKEYRHAIDDHGPKRQALRTAIEQALGQGEPVALLDVTYSKRSGMLESYAIRKMYEGAPSGVYAVYATAPQLQSYDQQALELCDKCGWKTLIPGEGCLNCERKPQREWVGLTDEDVEELRYHTSGGGQHVRLIEAKLREKNGGGV
jgi:hypothetical protein